MFSFCCFRIAFKNTAAYFLRSFVSVLLPHFYMNPLFLLSLLSLSYSISVIFPEISLHAVLVLGWKFGGLVLDIPCAPLPDTLYSSVIRVSTLLPVSAAILRLNLKFSGEHSLAILRLLNLSVSHCFPQLSVMKLLIALSSCSFPQLLIFWGSCRYPITCVVIDVVYGLWFCYPRHSIFTEGLGS